MNQVTVDIEQYLTTGQFGSHMAIPYFFKECFSHSHSYFFYKGGNYRTASQGFKPYRAECNALFKERRVRKGNFCLV